MHDDTTPAGPRDLVALLQQTRERISGLVEGLTDPQLDSSVPATPGLSVREVFAQLATADSASVEELLVDAVTREHDLRAALDKPGHRDDPAVLAALDALSDALSERVVAAGLPPLRITVEQWGTIAGHGAATRCLVADRFEFVRAMAGRRSAAQVMRWNWGTDPTPYLGVLSSTGSLLEEDLRERDPRVPEHLLDFDLSH